MAEKELRRLKRRELLQMLLMQCEETERLQQETDEMKEKMDVILESYERLKKKLDVKDERLNQKDAKIAELKREMEAMKAEKETGEAEITSITDAFGRLSEIFEETQKAIERYMQNVEKQDSRKNPFGMGKVANIRKKQNASRNGQIISINPGQLADSLGGVASSVENPDVKYEIAAVSGDMYG